MEKLRAFVEEGPGAKLSLAYMHGKSNSSTVILPQWAKKRGINLSMLFMEIYGSLGNANVINIYLQHVSKWPSCPRFAFKIKLLHLRSSKKEKKNYGAIQDLLCSARADNDDFLFFLGGGVGGCSLSH